MSTATAVATATASQPPSNNQPPSNSQTSPLWPNGQRLGFIGVCGEYQSGKTLFGLTIDPAHTIHFDTEKSGEPYQASLGFRRVDIPAMMAEKFPNGEYRPIQTFEAWLSLVRGLKPGVYRVAVLDTVSEIEAGLVEYVRLNPNKFGYTSAQFAKSEALMWGAAKDFWKQILSDILTRVETFVCIAHMRSIFDKTGRPTGEREAKGKETILELASLYLRLERKPDEKGRLPEKPAAQVLKTRLCAFVMNPETHEMEPHPVLPPRLPICTPATIRKYIQNPPDYSKLKKDELLQAEQLSDDQKLLLQNSIAANKAEAERLALTRQEQLIAAGKANATAGVVTADNHVAATQQPVGAAGSRNGQDDRPAGATTAATATPVVTANENGHATQDQLDSMLAVIKELKMPRDVWLQVLAKRNVKSARELTRQQAHELLANLIAKRQQLRGAVVPPSGDIPFEVGANSAPHG
jgi:hypothetical protein